MIKILIFSVLLFGNFLSGAIQQTGDVCNRQNLALDNLINGIVNIDSCLQRNTNDLTALSEDCGTQKNYSKKVGKNKNKQSNIYITTFIVTLLSSVVAYAGYQLFFVSKENLVGNDKVSVQENLQNKSSAVVPIVEPDAYWIAVGKSPVVDANGAVLNIRNLSDMPIQSLCAIPTDPERLLFALPSVVSVFIQIFSSIPAAQRAGNRILNLINLYRQRGHAWVQANLEHIGQEALQGFMTDLFGEMPAAGLE